METEDFVNSLLIFTFLLKNFKLLDNYWKLLEQDLEVKNAFTVLFDVIEAPDTSKLKMTILNFNSEQKFAKMEMFLQMNFLNQYSVYIFFYKLRNLRLGRQSFSTYRSNIFISRPIMYLNRKKTALL